MKLRSISVHEGKFSLQTVERRGFLPYWDSRRDNANGKTKWISSRALEVEDLKDEHVNKYYFYPEQIRRAFPKVFEATKKHIKIVGGGNYIPVSSKGHLVTNTHVIQQLIYKNTNLFHGAETRCTFEKCARKLREISLPMIVGNKTTIQMENPELLFIRKGALTFWHPVSTKPTKPDPDVAVIHVSALNKLNIEPIKFTEYKPDSDEPLFVIASPNVVSNAQVVSVGFIDYNEIPWKLKESGLFDHKNTFPFTALASEHSSGGMVVNSEGELVGMIYGGDSFSPIQSLAVKGSYLKSLLRELKICV